MSTTPWQKSSYCGEGESCVHVAATPEAIRITESGDPTGAILTTTPAAFGTLLSALKKAPHRGCPEIEIAVGEGHGDDIPVRIHTTGASDTVVTTDRRRWDAFVLGVRAGEFDHFATAELDSSD